MDKLEGKMKELRSELVRVSHEEEHRISKAPTDLDPKRCATSLIRFFVLR
jgi:hypothetical protein